MIASLTHRLPDEGLEIIRAIHVHRMFIRSFDGPTVNCNRLELVVQPAHAERGGVGRNGLSLYTAHGGELEHQEGRGPCGAPERTRTAAARVESGAAGTATGRTPKPLRLTP